MEQQRQLLCDDVFCGAMRWMDGETLAIAGCVSSSFHRESRNEQLWEDLCAGKWPSVSCARPLIQQLGGFHRLYSECSRLVSPDGSPPPTKAAVFSPQASDFASLVDVQFQGKTLFSRFVDGIPGTGTELTTEWFSSCPFRVDLIQESSCLPQQDRGGRMEEDTLSSSSSSSTEMGKLWKEISEGMKLSWILIDKGSKQAANLSSWRPVLGQRHWPTDMDFILRYGSILSQCLPKPVECSIILKCRLLRSSGSSIEIKLTELSMQLKDVGSGEHLNGRDGLPVLCQAVSFAKCRDEERVLRTHRELLKRQNELKVHELKHEWCLDVYVLVLVLAALALLLWTV
ncbi:hypothetical protein SELMODRAFT_95860 [Selaginella moellendorffii]|uniref:Putative F-box GID2 protein n=1 Tax=Selaginella moellendorffii TaxID=88036 RepID=A9LY12_SELML|nr:probable F-box protein At2g36090 [Selaginella moellendorffii]ABX10761.1 putative F-box GID2 protein [Selaginella moellendorffii]EFJ27306.1 hypothetical protein SELMODRAFT_95860 [Selaginella moellendorffii]|eukprot:XP_002971557.1 probable F-box protein At2g36090 [Selaginella moellendorffii]